MPVLEMEHALASVAASAGEWRRAHQTASFPAQQPSVQRREAPLPEPLIAEIRAAAEPH